MNARAIHAPYSAIIYGSARFDLKPGQIRLPGAQRRRWANTNKVRRPRVRSGSELYNIAYQYRRSPSTRAT